MTTPPGLPLARLLVWLFRRPNFEPTLFHAPSRGLSIVVGLLIVALNGLPSYGWQSLIGGVVGGVCKPATGPPLTEEEVVETDIKSSVISESAGDGDLDSTVAEYGEADDRCDARTEMPRASCVKLEGAEARLDDMLDEDAV